MQSQLEITESMRKREGLVEQKAGLTSTNEALEKEVTVCMQLDVHAYNGYYTYIHNFDIFYMLYTVTYSKPG